MKLYRILVKMDNGCYQSGFYHEDKDFLLKALEVTRQQNPGFVVSSYMEEVDLNLDLIPDTTPAAEEVLEAVNTEVINDQENK